jgi:hypothetical protein
MSNLRKATLTAMIAITSCLVAPEADAQHRQRADRDLLTQADLRQLNSGNAMDAVQTLRPLWLHRRGHTGVGRATPVRVYIDGLAWGSADALGTISLSEISSMRYVGGVEASQRWGPTHSSGAILLNTL